MKNRNLIMPISFFIGIVVMFVYLLVSPANNWVQTGNASLFTAVFKFGLNSDFTSMIFLRLLLVFSGAFSLSWLVFSLGKKEKN